MTEDKRKAKKYIGDSGYEENMVNDSKHQAMLKRLEDMGIPLDKVSFADKGSKDSAKNMMEDIVNTLTKGDDND
tara:strand:- start:621 stop:842 length:222 start_codon:yes stop_codon:yes gene_type:complete